MSSLRVVVAVYNGGERESMDWAEMLAYLTGHNSLTNSVLIQY